MHNPTKVAAVAAIGNNDTRYGSSAGQAELVDAARRYAARHYGFDPGAQRVLPKLRRAVPLLLLQRPLQLLADVDELSLEGDDEHPLLLLPPLRLLDALLFLLRRHEFVGGPVRVPVPLRHRTAPAAAARDYRQDRCYNKSRSPSHLELVMVAP